MPRKLAKYPTLTAFAEARRSGEVPAAHCTFDKEVVEIYAGPLGQGPDAKPELLCAINEVNFILAALEAFGVEADHV